MKTISLPLFNELSLVGLTNKLILIELSEEKDDLEPMLSQIEGKTNIIFCPMGPDPLTSLRLEYSCWVKCERIYFLRETVRKLKVPIDNIIISRLDQFDTGLDPKDRGSMMSAYIQMLTSPLLLKGASLIVTSANTEYKIREIADESFYL